MMTQFFKKWSAALVFAILLHLDIIFLFYVNSYENRTNNIDHGQKLTEDPIIITSIGKDYPPTIAKAHKSSYKHA